MIDDYTHAHKKTGYSNQTWLINVYIHSRIQHKAILILPDKTDMSRHQSRRQRDLKKVPLRRTQ